MKILQKVIITLCFLLISVTNLYSKPLAELVKKAVIYDNIERVYFTHYPQNTVPAKPTTLLIVMHGGNGNPERMAERTGFNEISDREGFIVVYPASIGKQWNDGRGKTARRDKNVNDIDDVGFISTLIDDFISAGESDSSNIFVTGMSNGGMMSYRLGIEIGNKIRAIAAVIANIPVNIYNEKPVEPLPVLIMNGTDDPIVPWEGGKVKILWSDFGEVVSTEKTVKYWLNANSIVSNPNVEKIPDNDKKDKCRVERVRYKDDGNPNEVVLYTIAGGGHNLPGGNTPDRPRIVGNKCMDINAAEVIWEFFSKLSEN